MNKNETLRLALEALQNSLTEPNNEQYEIEKNAITAIKEALETKDEPVAWGMEKDGVILDVICPTEHEREEGEYTIPLYTHPKDWVGLTDEEIEQIYMDTMNFQKMARALEAKLKDKNT
jgi:hypothetical protein